MLPSELCVLNLLPLSCQALSLVWMELAMFGVAALVYVAWPRCNFSWQGSMDHRDAWSLTAGVFDKPRCMGLPQRGSAAREFATAKASTSCWFVCRTKTKGKLANAYEADSPVAPEIEIETSRSVPLASLEDAPLREAKESWKHWEQARRSPSQHRLEKADKSAFLLVYAPGGEARPCRVDRQLRLGPLQGTWPGPSGRAAAEPGLPLSATSLWAQALTAMRQLRKSGSEAQRQADSELRRISLVFERWKKSCARL